MNVYTGLLLAAALATVTNCTPREDVMPPVAPEGTMAGGATGSSGDTGTGMSDTAAMPVDRSVPTQFEITSQTDIPGYVSSLMARADADSNGSLTADEFAMTASSASPGDASISAGGSASTTGGDVGGSATVSGTSAQLMGGEGLFGNAAGDDAELSAAELEAALTERFTAANTDGDDTLSAEEASVFSASLQGTSN